MTFKFYEEERTVKPILGAIIKEPGLLDTPEAAKIDESDFETIHRLIFFSIKNLFNLGHNKITGESIYNYLLDRPNMKNFFEKENGYQIVNESLESALNPYAFGPAVDRLKKFSLLRGLDALGTDVSFLYDLEATDPSTIQRQNEYIDSTSIIEIGSIISDRIDRVIERTTENSLIHRERASTGLRELVAGFRESPEMGSAIYGDIQNTIVRGARLGKFYLRSSPTGGGKTRQMVADLANIATDVLYSWDEREWVPNGIKEPTQIISTELDISEIQTLLLAFVSGIDEEKILDGDYSSEEEVVLEEALAVIDGLDFFITEMPNFSITDIESDIRRGFRENKVNYFGFDYIHSSMKFLQEVTKATNGMKLREDQILFMLSTKMKELAVELDIFIQSATQLSGPWQTEEEINQNLLRGARSIADRIDVGQIGMRVREIDRGIVEKFVENGYPEPNYFIAMYKLRRGKFSQARIWCKADFGTCRFENLFATGYNFEIIDIPGTEVKYKPTQGQRYGDSSF